MRKLKADVLWIALLLPLTVPAQAQTCSVQLVQRVSMDSLYVDVEIGQASEGFVLGTSTFVFNYDTAALGSPRKLSANDGPWDNTDADYLNVGLSQGLGYAGLTLEFTGGEDNNGALVPTTGFQRAGTIFLRINVPMKGSGLSWRNVGVNTQVFKVTSPGAGTGQTDITSSCTFVSPENFPLPIRLGDFTAAYTQGRGVDLVWETLAEYDNAGFYIQRRDTQNTTFADLPQVFLPGYGTTTERHTYAQLDSPVTEGIEYSYRLRQAGLDGTSRYSHVVTVTPLASVNGEHPREFALLQNYPNPFNPVTTVRFSVERSARARLVLYNVLGEVVATMFDDFAEAGRYYSVSIDGTRLSSGTYFYTLSSGDRNLVKKMLLLR